MFMLSSLKFDSFEESEPPLYHSMISPKCVPESLECDYSTELQTRVMSNNPIGFSCQEKINQKDAIQSSYSSTGDRNTCMATKVNHSSVDGFDENTDGFISAFVAPSSKKPSDSYVDKSVMECQMSKTIVCDREANVNDVKDICIDESASSLDNLIFRSTDKKSICKILPLEEDQNEGSIKEQENSSEVSKSIADEQKIPLEDDFAMDWTTHNDAKDLTHIEEAKLNLNDPKVSIQKLMRKSYSSESLDNIGVQDLTQIEEAKLNLDDPKVSIQKLIRKSFSSESLDNIGVQISGEKENSADPASVSKSVESCNGNSALSSAAESPNDSIPTHPSAYKNEVENGSIALNLNLISPVTNGGEEHHGNTNLHHPEPMTSSAGTQECIGSSDSAIQSQVSTNLEFRTSDGRLVSSQTPHDVGESSFSVVDPSLASLVTYSGPIAYSGSVSLRSESSTTSTRSFAFPILQTEWNSSPVKMVKAERRHYRKYRGWREGLLCCKF